MKNDLFNTEIDEIIRASMKLADEPDPELNNKLKATLYQKETAMRKQPATRGFSLWYLPMILNLITFIMLAGVALIVISNTFYLTLLLVSVSTLDWQAFCLPSLVLKGQI